MIDWWPIVTASAGPGIVTPLAVYTRAIGGDDLRGLRKRHGVPSSRLGGAVDRADEL